MATERSASVVWQGDLMNGSGTIAEAPSGAFGPLDVSWASRAETPNGKTSPEELIASAWASCFAMALSGALARGGNPPEKLETSATVTFQPGEGITKGVLGVMTTSWSWPSSIACRVCAMNALTSLAKNISPSPTPTTRGEFRLAATSTVGTSAWAATSVNAPSSFRQTTAILAGRSPAVGPDSNARANRCATTSVSVSLDISMPEDSRSARKPAKFSMMPLCTTATFPDDSVCGCAFRSVGPP